MNTREFRRQVWRYYDFIEIEGLGCGRLVAVNFPATNVYVSINGENRWFRCKYIVNHISKTGRTDDLAIIENLHNKFIAAENRIGHMENIINSQSKTIQKLKKLLEEKED